MCGDGKNPLTNAVQEALSQLEEADPDFCQQIRPIICQNLTNGRIGKFLKSRSVSSVEAYIDQVCVCYRATHEYVAQVKAGDDIVWDALMRKFFGWASLVLASRDFPAGTNDREDHAWGCVHEVALVILHKDFPYDTEFDPWARRTLIYTSYRYVDNHYKTGNITTNKAVSLEDFEDWLYNLVDPTAEQTIEQQADLALVKRAMSKLTPTQRRIIELSIFEHKGTAEIAEIEDCTISAVYKRKHDAIKMLRKILGDNSDT